ncbi:acyl-CoA esterase [Pantoea dispersa EGD-AAK13]|jgi:esterase|uniref:esterase n=1 Tax=Pantoea TaxID=53335 RepID=UPI0003973E6B|nr:MULTISPECIES: esterase [Pantoea]MBK4768747.1 esterase [Pantoea sp. Morm]ERH63395.1 acyl-CoA esterase [Pantoea dispersa EGD-AAK13]KAA6104105.1 esterase [Pantoea sp. B_9]KAA6108677.1 esterase [Pantoea sp. B_10]KTS00222.1 acyl-CoA esterase [Pantoea dispersa]
MILNARLQTEQSAPDAQPILLIHGLFGSLDNLGVLARGVRDARPTLQVDVRNHGLSPRSEEMHYAALAQDMVDTLDAHHIERVDVIGHSMGGKIAMALSAVAPERIGKMVLIDIAPVDYQTRRHDEIFAAIRAVSAAGVTRRSAAADVMREHVREEGVIQFILKSFHEGEWRFNVPVLWDNYPVLSGWQEVPAWPHPALFIRGGDSPYLDNQHRDALLRQFPQAQAHIISGAGHWVHAEKPDAVLRAVRRFFNL